MIRVTIAVVAACVVTACGPSGEQRALKGEGQAAQGSTYPTPDPVAERASATVQGAASAEEQPLSYAEMLKGIDAMPEPGPVYAPSDVRWFGASVDRRTCDPITIVGVSSPFEFVDLAQAEGRDWYIARQQDDRVQVRDRDRPDWPGMTFIQGQTNCLRSVDSVARMQQ